LTLKAMFCDSSRASRNRVSRAIGFLIFVGVLAHSSRATDTVPQELPVQEEQAALRKAESTGLAIYKHDRAAWVATDAIATIGGTQSDRGVRGWITEERNDGILVTFISGNDDHAPQALYRVSISTNGDVSGPPQELKVPEALTDSESGAAAARAFALKSPFQRCADDYNTVVLPADSSPSPNWAVYLLPATKDVSRIPLGGAHRLEFDSTRQNLVSERGFTKACLVLGDPKGDSKHRPVGLFTTHLLDPVPTEVHVFWNLWTGIPLYIATPPNGTIWKISKGQISLVKRGEAK
jgi:hypothetical protein